jgi:mRNA-degrading endonuclease RelE of RelBE toxin-antitoxin system
VYAIEFTPQALDDLKALRRFDQQLVRGGVKAQLLYEPAVPATGRKRMRPNEIAGWELKIGKFRVFYNVEEPVRVVTIEAIGVKLGNRVYIRGEEKRL